MRRAGALGVVDTYRVSRAVAPRSHGTALEFPQ